METIYHIEVMSWAQMALFFIGVFSLFIWNRAENRADYRHIQSLQESQRNLIDEIRKEGIEWRKQIMDENKDFHNRLCKIEAERNSK